MSAPNAPHPTAQPLAALALAVLLLPVIGAPARAQTITDIAPGVKFMEMNAGDLDDRTYAYALVRSSEVPSIVFLPPEGLGASIYLDRPAGEPGWMRMALDAGWNSFAFDLVGCGKSLPPTTDDLGRLVDKALYGVVQSGASTQCTTVFAAGISAAFLIKARASDPQYIAPAVLLDPIGPRGAQAMTALTPDQLVARRRKLADALWVEWGAGPVPGKESKNSDLGRAGFQTLLATYQRNQPQYWAAALSNFQTPLAVSQGSNLSGWRVLILRSPGRSGEQIAREDQLAAWLGERGVKVERRKLEDLGLAGLSALPMCGRNASAVFHEILTWSSQFIPAGKAPHTAPLPDQAPQQPQQPK
jgi:hypothetical protein